MPAAAQHITLAMILLCKKQFAVATPDLQLSGICSAGW
jgi:hypothetical protein